MTAIPLWAVIILLASFTYTLSMIGINVILAWQNHRASRP